jgi:hypothetical protein
MGDFDNGESAPSDGPAVDARLARARQDLEMSLLSAPLDADGQLDVSAFHPEDHPSRGEKIGGIIANVVFFPVTIGYAIKERRGARHGKPTVNDLYVHARGRYDDMLRTKHASIMDELRSLTEDTD